jgi:pyruvate dehydrogenase E2 component (dihydrolipoamide acetyltransferase)
MPLLSDTMTEGKIVTWHKKLGDFVKADDVLAEVETDKATMEVVGYEEGTLLYRGVEAGAAAKINEIIAIVGKAGTDVSAYIAAEKSGANNQATAIPATTVSSTSTAAITANNSTNNAGNDQRIKASPLAKNWLPKKELTSAK